MQNFRGKLGERGPRPLGYPVWAVCAALFGMWMMSSCTQPLNDSGSLVVQSYRPSPAITDVDTALPRIDAKATSLRTVWNLSLFSNETDRPDLALAEVGHDVFSLHGEKKLMDTSPLWQRSEVYKQLNPAIDRWVRDTFGASRPVLPVSFQLWGLWANPKLTSVPANLVDFENNLKSLHTRGITPIALGSSFGWPALLWVAQIDAALHGSEEAMALWSGKRSFSDPKTQESLAIVQRWRDQRYFDSTAPTKNWPEALQLFADGGAAYVMYGSGAVLRSGNWQDFVFAPLPRPQTVMPQRSELVFTSIEGFVLNANSTRSEQAVVFAGEYTKQARLMEYGPGTNQGPNPAYRIAADDSASTVKEGESRPGLIQSQVDMLRPQDRLMLLPDRILGNQAAYNLNQIMIEFFAAGSTIDAVRLGSMLDGGIKAR